MSSSLAQQVSKKIRGRTRKNKTEMGAFANQMRMTRELKDFLDSEKNKDESYAEEILRLIRQERHEKITLKRQLDRM